MSHKGEEFPVLEIEGEVHVWLEFKKTLEEAGTASWSATCGQQNLCDIRRGCEKSGSHIWTAVTMSIWEKPPLRTDTNQGFLEGTMGEQPPKKETSAK